MSVRRTRDGAAFWRGLLRRDSGAVIHVLVMPWLDNIVELLFVLAPISCWAHGLPPALNALLISAHSGGHLRARHARKRFWPGVRPVEIRDRAMGIIIGTVVSAVITPLSGLKVKRAHCRKNWLARGYVK